MKRVLARRGLAAAFVLLAAIAVAGIAYASIPDANGVIHGCYRPTTGQLIVATSGKGCEEGWTPLNWNQTGQVGPTGPTGATGALSSAYLDAFSTVIQGILPGGTVAFTAFATGNMTLVAGTDITVVSSGIYQVTVDLQGSSFINAQLTVNGVGVGPPLQLNCTVSTCTFTRLLSVNPGGIIRLVSNSPGVVEVGSGITIVRIA